MNTTRPISLVLCVGALWACDATTGPATPELASPALATGGEGLLGDVVVDSSFASQVDQIASTCSGWVTSNYSVRFEHSGCLIVTPEGSSYSLTDDVALHVTMKRGLITGVQLTGQDVIGEDGIMHETDVIRIDPAVRPDPAGFTLHIHADQVEVWRLSGHLRGRRVAMIGTIALGDIVYTQPQ